MGTIVQKYQNEDSALYEAIKEFQNGNADKATYIYESTKKYTYRLIHQHVSRFKNQSVLTGDENSITEDVMQELYLDFFKNISKFRNEDPKSFYKWISIVSNRMVLKHVDKNKMEVLQSGKDEEFREDTDVWDSKEINDDDLEGNREIIPEAALEDKEFQKLIMDFVQSLPEVQAQTVIYHFYSGMKYQEIANEMGVSLITVKTRMRKAQDSLKEIIDQYEKKSGIKLHSVSVLPAIWIVYRLFAESTKVPATIGTVVTSSVAGQTGAVASGIGKVAAKGAGSAMKSIITKSLIAITTVSVLLGGAVVGSRIIDDNKATEDTQESHLKQEDINENVNNVDDKEEKSAIEADNTVSVDLDAVTMMEVGEGWDDYLISMIHYSWYKKHYSADKNNIQSVTVLQMGEEGLERMTGGLVAEFLVKQNFLQKETYQTTNEYGDEVTCVKVTEKELKNFCENTLGITNSYEAYLELLEKDGSGQYIISSDASDSYLPYIYDFSIDVNQAVQISDERIAIFGSYDMGYTMGIEWESDGEEGSYAIIARKNENSLLFGYTIERIIYNTTSSEIKVHSLVCYKNELNDDMVRQAVSNLTSEYNLSRFCQRNGKFWANVPVGPECMIRISETEVLALGQTEVVETIPDEAGHYSTDNYTVVSGEKYVFKLSSQWNESTHGWSTYDIDYVRKDKF